MVTNLTKNLAPDMHFASIGSTQGFELLI